MKKLLSFLGAMSLVASSGSVAIACKKEANPVVYEDTKNEAVAQNPKAEALTQYVKTLYANQFSLSDIGLDVSNGIKDLHYSPSEYFSWIQKQNINDLNFSQGISNDYKAYSDSKYSEAFDQYFDSKLIHDNTNIDDSIYKGGVIDSQNAIPSFVGTINTILPIIAKSFVNIDGSGIADLLKTLLSFESLIGSFKQTIDPIVDSLTADDNAVLKELESALSFTDQETTYVDAIQNSIIALAKSISGLAKKSSEDIKDFTSASKSIAKNLKGLIDGSISFSFDMSAVKYIGGIVKFVRVLLLYLDSFDENAVTETQLTVDDVLRVKQGAILKINNEKLNSLDIKKLIGILKKMTDDKDGQGLLIFKNVVNILFSTHDTLNYKGDDEVSIGGTNGKTYENEKEIYGRILGDLIIEVVGSEKMNAA
ncbi:hypothetical protein SHELI_v1c10560 [Spiroplasma helicoides]|uniref:MOLPALP family lipoprotein n=1 Tax=Spiroplasma helicoides TaxID=216938 RepID=A0A1B3SM48_9MOLU|nr:lipoprotein [Spiroplasma helicoides]AOG61003.1 hypothetical protein SHELI_v1c10560 [Spiroplasma helicoides]